MDVRLPGGVCFSDAPPLQLHGGRGRNTSPALLAAAGRGDFDVRIDPGTWVRGDVNEDGREEVVVVVVCEAAGGGTGSAPEVVVLSARSGQPRLLADLRPDGRGLSVGSATVSIITDAADVAALRCSTSGMACSSTAAIQVTAKAFKAGDAMCCPSQQATTTWRWDGEGLAQVDPAHSDCWNGQGPASSPATFDPSSGRYSAYVTAVDVVHSRLSAQIVRWLSGAQADAAYRAEYPEDSHGPPNDFFLDDGHPIDTNPSVELNAQVLALTNRNNALLTPGTLTSLATNVDTTAPDQPRLYWLRFEKGQVSDICEQYRP